MVEPVIGRLGASVLALALPAFAGRRARSVGARADRRHTDTERRVRRILAAIVEAVADGRDADAAMLAERLIKAVAGAAVRSRELDDAMAQIEVCIQDPAGPDRDFAV